jgi:hypothetical protein
VDVRPAVPASVPVQAVLEQLGVRIAVLDAEDRVVWCNATARSAWGDPAPGTAFGSLDREVRPVPLAGTDVKVAWEVDAAAREAALRRVAAESATLAHDVKNAHTSINLALRAVARALGEDEVLVLEDLAQRLRGIESRIRGALDATP